MQRQESSDTGRRINLILNSYVLLLTRATVYIGVCIKHLNNQEVHLVCSGNVYVQQQAEQQQ